VFFFDAIANSWRPMYPLYKSGTDFRTIPEDSQVWAPVGKTLGPFQPGKARYTSGGEKWRDDVPARLSVCAGGGERRLRFDRASEAARSELFGVCLRWQSVCRKTQARGKRNRDGPAGQRAIVTAQSAAGALDLCVAGLIEKEW